MGSVDSLVMPAGPPPCPDDPHHHAEIGNPPKVDFIPDLETKVKMANNYVESEFQAMIAARYKMKDAYTKLMNEYEQARHPLEKDCNQVRNTLQKIGEENQECEDVQFTNLGNAFEKRAKNPSNPPIKGCVDYKNDQALHEKSDCGCAAGSEEDGCKDAKIETDHTLGCTQLRKRVLPPMNLWTMTSPGGACYVGKDTWFNQGMLMNGEPSAFKMPNSADAASMPLPLLAAPPPTTQVARRAAERVPPAKRACARKNRARAEGTPSSRAETAAEQARAFL